MRRTSDPDATKSSGDKAVLCQLGFKSWTEDKVHDRVLVLGIRLFSEIWAELQMIIALELQEYIAPKYMPRYAFS
jgi:hypothetical protein